LGKGKENDAGPSESDVPLPCSPKQKGVTYFPPPPPLFPPRFWELLLGDQKIQLGSSPKTWPFVPPVFFPSLGCFARFFYRVFVHEIKFPKKNIWAKGRREKQMTKVTYICRSPRKKSVTCFILFLFLWLP
jgi:hypothetical protein